MVDGMRLALNMPMAAGLDEEQSSAVEVENEA